MAELRRRNGVISFSDHMNAYHAQMELLLTDGPAQAAGSRPAEAVRPGRSAGLPGPQAAQRGACDSGGGRRVPRLLVAVEQSVAALMQALLAQDAAQARVQWRWAGSKKPYSQLFLKFG